jgi:hypothetical protein
MSRYGGNMHDIVDISEIKLAGITDGNHEINFSITVAFTAKLYTENGWDFLRFNTHPGDELVKFCFNGHRQHHFQVKVTPREGKYLECVYQGKEFALTFVAWPRKSKQR